MALFLDRMTTYKQAFTSHAYVFAQTSVVKSHKCPSPKHTTGILATVTRQTLGHHALLLDEAVDAVVKGRLAKWRGDRVFGVGIASDESPPAGTRFSGFRFQVTYLYVPVFDPVQVWSRATSPPLQNHKYLLDVCHCEGKDGVSVMKVLTKQLDRLGLSSGDVVCGVGDGGGENEGISGVHSSFEHSNPSYIRRRCLGHLAWRAADAGLASMPESFKALGHIANYLHDGITWKRLQALAVTSEAERGLGLLREGSPGFVKIFNKAPPKILDGRPETNSHFLAWLIPRALVLSPCIIRDVADRCLGQEAIAAKDAMSDPLLPLTCAVQHELLERCLFLFRWGKKYHHISLQTNLPDLVKRCLTLITNMAVDDKFLERFSITGQTLIDNGCAWLQAFRDKSSTLHDIHVSSSCLHDVHVSSSCLHDIRVSSSCFRDIHVPSCFFARRRCVFMLLAARSSN